MLGKLLIYAGIVLIIIGLLILNFDKLGFLGRLPGDIRIEKENFRFYFPITSGILISIVLSVILFLIQKLR
ncbi:MAG: DUF2905 domain-containing protein [Cyclobacteriaceae bacterium]